MAPGEKLSEVTTENENGIKIKVAMYPGNGYPEVSEVSTSSPSAIIEKAYKLVVNKVNEVGGRVPAEAVRELIENLIHAEFRGAVISVLEGGNVVRISDKGPGIIQKDKAFEFGYSEASPEALAEIRGVGAGLGIARMAAEKEGGTVTLDDNLGGGAVAMISMVKALQESRDEGYPWDTVLRRRYPDGVPRMIISERQQKVLLTVLECGEVGPSTVADRLELSVSTAYRDLSTLEEHGLVTVDESGKRLISPLGRDLAEAITQHRNHERRSG